MLGASGDNESAYEKRTNFKSKNELQRERCVSIEEQLSNLPIITYDHLIHELTEEYIKETSISFLELLKN